MIDRRSSTQFCIAQHVPQVTRDHGGRDTDSQSPVIEQSHGLWVVGSHGIYPAEEPVGDLVASGDGLVDPPRKIRILLGHQSGLQPVR